MTPRGAVRATGWVVGALLLTAGTAGCGLRDRAVDAGGASTAPSAVSGAGGGTGAGAASAAGSGAASAGAAKPAAAQGPAVSPAQVAKVESVVGAATTVVSQGEAEVASDG